MARRLWGHAHGRHMTGTEASSLLLALPHNGPHPGVAAAESGSLSSSVEDTGEPVKERRLRPEGEDIRPRGTWAGTSLALWRSGGPSPRLHTAGVLQSCRDGRRRGLNGHVSPRFIC